MIPMKWFDVNEDDPYEMVWCKWRWSLSDLGPNTLKSIQIHYSYFDLLMITIALQLHDL